MHKFDNFSPPAVNSVDSLADSEVSICCAVLAFLALNLFIHVQTVLRKKFED